MRIKCLFKLCNWVNIADFTHTDGRTLGLWQCRNCKTLSIGRAITEPRIEHHRHIVGDHPPLIWIQSENAYFPLGAELTSKENGRLVLATPGTPRELIVGLVSMCGLETK